MKMLKTILLATSLIALNASGAEKAQTDKAPAASTAPVPAGDYTLDRAHASLLFRVDHLGFSHYTARFKRFDAQLRFDPNKLAASQLNVTVDATSLETDFPDPAKIDFNAQLQGEQWLNTAKYPQMTYRSTRIESTGPKNVRVTGDLTLRGITKPVVLNVTYNGGYAGHPMDPHARIGFSARGTLKRSDFGMGFGIPAPGTTMGVGDQVDIIIECEFTGPPLKSVEARK
jgi:polyisoprenoid-binding protein YceI